VRRFANNAANFSICILVLQKQHSFKQKRRFLADRTIGRAYGTVCRLSSVVCLPVCLSVVCDVLYCGKTVRPSQKVSEGVNRKPGSKN